ncbi:hypothetical protein BSKO_03237 [Bryopsis sp. KO-2023]|nr:hypothetical protein BSKO_03237 [Bryopsis sp. KO-2023]
MANSPVEDEQQTFEDAKGVKRVRDTEYVLPICMGTVAFWLGKKASEEKSHRWTVYVRSPLGEDMSHILESVTFRLHPSFPNAERVVSTPPYELTEHGWGEFDITIVLKFCKDSGDSELEVVHRLKLYSEESGNQSTKKAVVREIYEELVFSEPTVGFYERVSKAERVAAKDSDLAQHFPKHDEQHDLTKVRNARIRVASSLKKQKAQNNR